MGSHVVMLLFSLYVLPLLLSTETSPSRVKRQSILSLRSSRSISCLVGQRSNSSVECSETICLPQKNAAGRYPCNGKCPLSKGLYETSAMDWCLGHSKLSLFCHKVIQVAMLCAKDCDRSEMFHMLMKESDSPFAFVGSFDQRNS
jgi:hypothetical protein